MGFLDRLENSRIEKEQAQEAARIEAAKKVRAQKDQHTPIAPIPNEERRRAALRFREVSGIGLLVKRFGQILADEKTTESKEGDQISRGISKGPGYDILGVNSLGRDRLFRYPKIRKSDLDSVVDIAIWDGSYDGTGTDGKCDEWRAYHVKYLAAESTPEGKWFFTVKGQFRYPKIHGGRILVG